LQQSSLNNRIGRRGRVPPPIADFEARLDPQARAILADALGCAIVGGPDTVRGGLDDFIRRTGADELMVTANIFDHGKRKRSFEIVAEAHGGMRGLRPVDQPEALSDPDQAGEASGLPFSTT
jgi:alkanesulfonate monooxygenase SsuD/methylene tetrahydromethanopterin reductase-like flavin-dependent oxidoreductase (luciferase family)